MGKWAESKIRFFGVKNFLKLIVVVLMAVVLSAGVCFAGPLPEFEKLKLLVGAWKGTSMDGKPAAVAYTLVSDNSALMERLAMGGDSEMVTMYHPDGDHLMMTHYWSAHNQPRMRSNAVDAGGRKITFDLVEVTNGGIRDVPEIMTYLRISLMIPLFFLTTFSPLRRHLEMAD